jgi:hypothetical protein
VNIKHTEHALPIISASTLQVFAAKHPVKQVIPADTGRFVIPIPALQDGLGRLRLPNLKSMKAIIRSGGFGSKILEATLEGSPQLVPTDGTYAVIINNVSDLQAVAMQAVYDEIRIRRGGRMDRAGIIKFIETASGISYVHHGEGQDIVRYVDKNIGVHGDVFEVTRETFRLRNSRPGEQFNLAHVKDDAIQPGFYRKYANIKADAFVIDGGFIFQNPSGTKQNFTEPALITIGSDGIVSAIHDYDINISYRHPDKKPLAHEDGTIDAPRYPVGQLKREQERGRAFGKE